MCVWFGCYIALVPGCLPVGSTSHTKDGSVVRKCRVADGSGSILFSLWNEQAAAIEEGDILRLIKGYVTPYYYPAQQLCASIV